MSLLPYLLLCLLAADAPLQDVTPASGLPREGRTSGAALVDLDGDGDLDLVLGRHGPTPWAYLNQGDLRFLRWEDWARGSLLRDHHATAVGDVDGDGHPEIYLVAGAHEGEGVGTNELWRLWPRIVEIGHEKDVEDRFGRGRSALFLDLVGDAHPDLLVLNALSAPRLFDLAGAGPARDRIERLPGFVAVDESLLAADPRDESLRHRDHFLLQIAPTHLDGDDRPDLLVLGPPGPRLWKARDGGFLDASDLLPSEALDPGPAHACWADLDGDGAQDLYLVYGDGAEGLPRGRRNRLLLRRGDRFLSSSPRYGAGLDGVGHQSASADLDNDADLDLLVIRRAEALRGRPPVLLLGRGDGSFEPADGGLERIDEGVSQALVCADLDADGRLDLLLLQGDHPFREGPGGVRLLRNLSEPRGWIEFSLSGRPPRTDALGARVEIEVRGRRQTQEHWPTQAGGSSMILPLHFGLGEAAGVDRVCVRWPSGREEEWGPLEGGRSWTLREGEGR